MATALWAVAEFEKWAQAQDKVFASEAFALRQELDDGQIDRDQWWAKFKALQKRHLVEFALGWAAAGCPKAVKKLEDSISNRR